MADSTGIEWADSSFNCWVGCTKVSPACDHCYAETLMDHRMHKAKWGPGQPRVRTSAANWRKPVRWNNQTFYQCAYCGQRGIHYDFSEPCTASTEGIHWLQGARRRVFCASLADVFDNEVPIEWLVDLLDLIRRTPKLDWLLLTKRIGNWRKRLEEALSFCQGRIRAGTEPPDALGISSWIAAWLDGRAPDNVAMGITIVNQPEADRDVSKLLATPARVRFVSIEPMLGAVDLKLMARAYGFPKHIDSRGNAHDMPQGLHWIIAGGESGPHARPSHPDWFRSLRDQCAAAGVAFMFKQWGEWSESCPDERDEDTGDHRQIDADGSEADDWFDPRTDCLIAQDGRAFRSPDEIPNDTPCRAMTRLGKKLAGRLLDGVEHSGFPEVVRG